MTNTRTHKVNAIGLLTEVFGTTDEIESKKQRRQARNRRKRASRRERGK